MKNIFEYADNFSKYRDVESILRYCEENETEITVSVLIPTYNHSQYLKEAITSCINQTYDREYEIIVVDNTPYNIDDPRNDDTLELIKGLHCKFLKYYQNTENIGMFGNWNRCIELANSDNIIFCHSDDILFPQCISTLMSVKRNDNKYIASKTIKIDGDGKILNGKKFNINEKFASRIKNIYSISNYDVFVRSITTGVGALLSRQRLIEIGGFSDDYYPASDTALFAVYTVKYGGKYCSTPLTGTRIAENASSDTYKDFAKLEKFIHLCVLDHVHIPRWVGEKIININYKYSKAVNIKRWRDENARIPIKDKIIMRLIYGLLNVKKIRFFTKERSKS